jgi:hypothetical protein
MGHVVRWMDSGVPIPGPGTTCCSSSAGIFKQSMRARNRVGKGLLYRPARLHWLVKLITCNRFLRPLSFKNSVSGHWEVGDMGSTLHLPRPDMDFLDIFTKDSSLLLHAIHSPLFWRILKKTILFAGFKNPYIKILRNKKTGVYS